MYYSTENYYIVGDLKEMRKDFLFYRSQEIKELEKAIEVIEESKELKMCVYPIQVIHERLDVICDDYPFFESDKLLKIFKETNIDRLYQIESNRIVETVPKLNFFSSPVSNYYAFKVQEKYIKSENLE